MLSKFSVKKPMTVFVSVIFVILLGIISFLNTKTDLLPSLDLPYMTVVTTYPGASPEKVEQNVTRPIEQGLSTTSGIKKSRVLQMKIQVWYCLNSLKVQIWTVQC